MFFVFLDYMLYYTSFKLACQCFLLTFFNF
nr:MAG TPA: hypothetical protein [Caudoviricetes sp.]